MSKKIIGTPIEHFTRLLFGKVIERLAVIASEEHLSFSQVAALHIIDREFNLNINDIAMKLNLSMSATSRMVDELVKIELVERKEDQKNRRSKTLSLSSSGKLFMDRLSIERMLIIRQSAGVKAGKNTLKFVVTKILGKGGHLK